MTVAEEIEGLTARLEQLTIDDIKRALEPHKDGMVTRAVRVSPGSFLYRARKCDARVDKQDLGTQDLSYPRKNVSLGRANREGAPAFYASESKEPVFFEMRVTEGDELLIGNWQLNAELLVNSIGYTDRVFSELSATRPCPVWETREQPSYDAASGLTDEIRIQMDAAQARLKQEDPDFDIVETFGREFTRCDERMYKLSTAISELHLGEIVPSALKFGGLIYPSVQMFANSDNFALLPWFADHHLGLRGVLHVRVTSRAGARISFDELDYATRFDKDGSILWNGGPASITIPPFGAAKCYVKPGIDEFGFDVPPIN